MTNAIWVNYHEDPQGQRDTSHALMNDDHGENSHQGVAGAHTSYRCKSVRELIVHPQSRPTQSPQYELERVTVFLISAANSPTLRVIDTDRHIKKLEPRAN